MQLVFKHNTLNLDTPAVMGILNVTPDSFFDGGKYGDEKAILRQVEKMLSEEADIIDIGACSTRPNAPEISEEEELKRLIPAIKIVRKEFPKAIISADTFRSKVAIEAVGTGSDMINDVSGGSGFIGESSTMFEAIINLKVPYVLTHAKGTPQNMQQNPDYKDVVKEVKSYFYEKLSLLKRAGVNQLILDPGFGFGKTLEHNYALLKNLKELIEFNLPVLAGISRKGMIYKALQIMPESALNGTTVANSIALMNGASILRVHDVKEAREAVKIYKFAR